MNKKVDGRLLGSSVYLGASPMSWVVTYVSGSLFLETSVPLHTFQLSLFVRETPIFVVGFSCCCANTKSPAAKLCFKKKHSRLRKNLLKILQNWFATKMASLRNLCGRKSLWFLTPEQLNKFMSNSALVEAYLPLCRMNFLVKNIFKNYFISFHTLRRKLSWHTTHTTLRVNSDKKYVSQ